MSVDGIRHSPSLLKEALWASAKGGAFGLFMGLSISATSPSPNLAVTIPVGASTGMIAGALSGAITQVAYLILKRENAGPGIRFLMGCGGAMGGILTLIGSISPFPSPSKDLFYSQVSIMASASVLGAIGSIWSQFISASCYGGGMGTALGLLIGRGFGAIVPQMDIASAEKIGCIGGIFGVIGAYIVCHEQRSSDV